LAGYKKMDECWLDLLNSDYHDYLGRHGREDRLENPDWLRQFLSRWDLSPAERSSRNTRNELHALRTLLRGIVDEILAGRSASRKQRESLNIKLAAAKVIRRLEKGTDGYEILFLPVTGGINRVLADIVASFAWVFTHGDLSRIKLCQNPDCRWVIYDESKNRSRLWCEGSTGCGNLMKVRRHRARTKRS
jgi:predicted RNA-binding Zn ribbon-like protein